MKKTTRLMYFLSVAAVVLFSYGCDYVKSGTSESYQHDMDIARLNDLKSIGSYVEEYFEKQGTYPLVGSSDVPVYVYIATDKQSEYIKGGPPYPHDVVDIKVFIQELEEGLGRKIAMPFDPQKVPVNKPNFYIYMVNGDTYNLAVHLHNEYQFTKNIGPYYNKVEVSNSPNPQYAIWGYENLMADSEFIKAASEKPNKPGYVESMRK